ncbi:hypothetical protein BGZ79_003763 [Entomortierella chlamydospora]|nr:hypothetical protein BGZ79_003763 [Entomortierella chlamydospora]
MALTTDIFVDLSIHGEGAGDILDSGFEIYDQDDSVDLDTDPEEQGYDGDDYSSNDSDSEQEIVWEFSDSSVESNNPKIDSVAESLEKSTTEAPTEDGADEAADVSSLSEDKEARAINLASTIVSAQLQDYSWIESTVPEAKIRDIVGGLKIKKEDYDYLPHVFYVDKEAFELWKDRDTSNHFFIWNKGNSEANSGNKVNDDSSTNGEDVDNDKSKLNSFQLYFCHCAGHPRRKKVKNQDQSLELQPVERPAGELGERPAKKTWMVLKPSKKVGCKARLIVHDVKSDKDEYASKGNRSQLRVVYFYKHTGHVLGSAEDFQHLKVTEGTKTRIRNLHDHVLKYEDVYNIYHKYSTEQSQLGKNDRESMRLWMDKLKDKGFTVFMLDYHIVVDRVRYPKFAYGFMSPFQETVYKSNFKHIGLDSTHGTNRSKHELYTIIVRNPISLSAVPVAFMLTNDHSHQPLAKWLNHIKENIGSPEYITTDDA